MAIIHTWHIDLYFNKKILWPNVPEFLSKPNSYFFSKHLRERPDFNAPLQDVLKISATFSTYTFGLLTNLMWWIWLKAANSGGDLVQRIRMKSILDRELI